MENLMMRHIRSCAHIQIVMITDYVWKSSRQTTHNMSQIEPITISNWCNNNYNTSLYLKEWSLMLRRVNDYECTRRIVLHSTPEGSTHPMDLRPFISHKTQKMEVPGALTQVWVFSRIEKWSEVLFLEEFCHQRRLTEVVLTPWSQVT